MSQTLQYVSGGLQPPLQDSRPVLPLEPLLVRPLPSWRRALDFTAALAGLILLSPLLILIALAIKTTSAGPVFFVQERTGLNQRRFKILKFRTMVPDAQKRLEQVRHLNEMTGPLIKIRNDPRLTRIGHLLRVTSLDELPQLVNVLRGEMTLIGPRALSPLPTQYEPWQRRRFAVTPGIACAWQAEQRGERDFMAWMRSDLRYVDHASPQHDLGIFFKVLLRVALCRGSK